MKKEEKKVETLLGKEGSKELNVEELMKVEGGRICYHVITINMFVLRTHVRQGLSVKVSRSIVKDTRSVL